MRKSLLLPIYSALLLFSFHTSLAQQTYLQKLEITSGETYLVPEGNILKVDTLIMHDKSAISFNTARHGVLEASAAFIGNKCLITSKGKDGSKGKQLERGQDGEDGGSLNLVMHFEQLGQLTIDSRGGHGGNGANGKNGKPGSKTRTETRTRAGTIGPPIVEQIVVPGTSGTDGTDATQGGNSGNGGDLTFAYSSADFIPVFNNTSRKEHSIIILTTAGSKGNAGKPGKGGVDSVDGTVRSASFKKSYGGRIQLINLNDSKRNF